MNVIREPLINLNRVLQAKLKEGVFDGITNSKDAQR